MALEVRTATRVSDITPEEWDRLSGGRPFSSHAWYLFGEKVLQQQPCTYILIYQSGALVARAAFWLSRQEPLPLSYAPLRLAVSAFLRRRPLFICRSPLADWSALHLPNSPEREGAFTAICETALRLAQEKGASFAGFDYLDASEMGAGWQSQGFTPLALADPGTCLAIPGGTFTEYLKGLSKSTQKDYRRHTNQAAGRGIQVTAHPAVVETVPALALIRRSEKRHKTIPKPWAERLLQMAGQAQTTWLTAHQADRLVGCGLIIGDGPSQLATLLGIHDRVQYVYFQLVYTAIRNAMQQQARILRAGSGAYPFKQRLGFTLENNNYFTFKGCTPANQRIGHWLSRLQN